MPGCVCFGGRCYVFARVVPSVPVSAATRGTDTLLTPRLFSRQHGGTPNLGEHVRAIPAAIFALPPEMGGELTGWSAPVAVRSPEPQINIPA